MEFYVKGFMSQGGNKRAISKQLTELAAVCDEEKRELAYKHDPPRVTLGRLKSTSSEEKTQRLHTGV